MFRKSAGIPCVAVLVCASKRGARTDVFRKSPPGRKFRHAAYNIDTCRGEAESPKTRFTWPAWRSNYFPGIHLYYYIVPGGELCGVALGVYGGKGVNMWRSVNFMCVANFRPAVVSALNERYPNPTCNQLTKSPAPSSCVRVFNSVRGFGVLVQG